MTAFRDGAGRVHLVVERDGASGRDQVRLDGPLFEEPWQDEVVLSTALTTLGMLGDAPTLATVLDLTRHAMAAASRLIAGLLAQVPDGAVACKAGCSHCCHVVVGVTPPEALTIFEHLKSSLSVSELAHLAARVAAAHERIRGLTSAERFSPDHPCVFLEAGRCSIYTVRPLACRGMNSLDAAECETRLNDPTERAAFAANGGGHLFVEPVRAFRAISAGLQLGLLDLYHLDMRPLDLIAVMRLLLETDGALGHAWMAGQQLEHALLDGRGDQSSNP